MRWIATALALIASIGQILPMCVLALAVPTGSYFYRRRFLRPFIVLLIPFIAAVIVFIPFWMLAMASNSYLYCKDAVSGSVEARGIRLLSRRRLSRELLKWGEIRSIRWEPPRPLGSHYVIELADGSEVKIHSLPFDSPWVACEQVRDRAALNDE